MTEDNKEDQKELAQSHPKFIKRIAFNEERKVGAVEFTRRRLIESSSTPQNITLQIPLLEIVPIPHIGINDVQIDFDVNVTANENSTENKE